MDGFNLGAAPQLNSGVNPWGNIANAINQGLQTRKDDIEHQQDRAVVQQQNQAAIAESKRNVASAQWDQMKPFLLSNEIYQKDPRVNKQIDTIFQDMGVPAPRNADGTLDLESIKPQIDVNSEAYQKYIQLSPGPAKEIAYKTLAKQYGGLDPASATAGAVMSPKEAAIMANLQAKTKDLGIKENLAAQREANKENWQKMQSGLIDAKISKYRADVLGIQASIGLKMAETAQIPQRIAIAQQNANTAAQRANQMLTSGRVERSQWNQNMATIKDIQSQYHQMDNQKKDLERLQATYQAQGVPDDDPKLSALSDQISVIQTGLDKLKPTVDDADKYLQTNVNNIITGNTMSQQSGKPSQVMDSGKKQILGHVPSGVKPGKYTVHGQRVEVYADGSYAAI